VLQVLETSLRRLKIVADSGQAFESIDKGKLHGSEDGFDSRRGGTAMDEKDESVPDICVTTTPDGRGSGDQEPTRELEPCRAEYRECHMHDP